MTDNVTIKPDLRVHHPEYGDITEDVARELARMTREDDEQLAHTAYARQAAIVAARPGDGRIANGFALNSEVDARIYDFWRRREGGGGGARERLRWFKKKHPELFNVRLRPDNPTVRLSTLPAYRVTGKRGRWAL